MWLWRLIGRRPSWAMRPWRWPQTLEHCAAARAAREAGTMRIIVYSAKDGWRWRAVARNGRIVGDGAEAYTRKRSAVRAARAFLRSAANTKIVVG